MTCLHPPTSGFHCPPTHLPACLPVQVTSSAKRKLKPGSTKVHQTPDGSFYDLQQNARDMLTTHCGMQVPEVRFESGVVRGSWGGAGRGFLRAGFEDGRGLGAS
jgi:hypothetical protein